MSARLAAALASVVLLAALAVAGCAGAGKQASLEEQAQQIDRRLICPVCPGETIDQSRAELAKQMRAIVRERLAAGESREQILQFFVDRYGPGVLAAPPGEGFNRLAWVVPPIAVLGGLALVVGVVRAMGRRRPEPAVAEAEFTAPPELEPYLAAVDRDVEEMLRARKQSEGRVGSTALGRPSEGGPGPLGGEG